MCLKVLIWRSCIVILLCFLKNRLINKSVVETYKFACIQYVVSELAFQVSLSGYDLYTYYAFVVFPIALQVIAIFIHQLCPNSN